MFIHRSRFPTESLGKCPHRPPAPRVRTLRAGTGRACSQSAPALLAHRPEGTAQARAGLFLAQREDEDLGGGSCVPCSVCTEMPAETLGVGWGPSPLARGVTASQSPLHRPSSGPRGGPAGLKDGRPGQEGLARPARAHHGTLTGRGAPLHKGRRAEPVSDRREQALVWASPHRAWGLHRCSRASAQHELLPPGLTLNSSESLLPCRGTRSSQPSPPSLPQQFRQLDVLGRQRM